MEATTDNSKPGESRGRKAIGTNPGFGQGSLKIKCLYALIDPPRDVSRAAEVGVASNQGCCAC